MDDPKLANTKVGISKESVKYERKFDLGNYEMLEVGCTLWAKVPVGIDHGTFMSNLWEIAKRACKFAYAKQVHGATDLEVFEGVINLPIETIAITLGRKVNTGRKYENATISNSLWYNLDDAEEWSDVMPTLWQNLFVNVAAAIPGSPLATAPLGVDDADC